MSSTAQSRPTTTVPSSLTFAATEPYPTGAEVVGDHERVGTISVFGTS
jgi:hypothetical protein